MAVSEFISLVLTKTHLQNKLYHCLPLAFAKPENQSVLEVRFGKN